MSPPIQDRPIRDVHSILHTMNAVAIPTADKDAHYKVLRGNDKLADSQVLRMINGLEIEDFIPAKIAILLKLNWEDKDFSSALLSNIVADLRDGRKVISRKLADHILGKIDQGIQTEVLHLLYACMRYHEGQDVYHLDDIATLSQDKLMEFIQAKELLHSKQFLEKKLIELSDRFANAKGHLTTLLAHLRENDAPAFRKEYIKFLDEVAKQQPEGVKQIAFEELKETVEQLPSARFFASLYRILKTHEFYGKQLVEVIDLTRSLQSMEPEARNPLLERCHKAFQNTLYLLADFKNMPCGSMTTYCLQHGLVRQEWLKINKLFEGHRHALCDCHAVKDPSKREKEGTQPHPDRAALWPLHQREFSLMKRGHSHEDHAESVAILGCNWGSGHLQTTLNISEICEDKGMHPVTVDIPDDMLYEHDPIRRMMPKWMPLSVRKVFNELLKFKAFATINFLRKMSGDEYLSENSKVAVRQTLQRLLLINPSVVINTYGNHNEPAIKAASLMGVPCMHVLTDVDRSIPTRKKPPVYDHFKAALPYPEAVMVPRESTTERPDQIDIVGPPSKRVYDLDRTPAQVDQLRKELEQQLEISIPPGKKLIVVSNGSNGSFSPYPDLLVKKYAGKKPGEIPFVVVVLCGHNNDAFFNHVTKISAHLPLGVIKPCRLVPPETMEKLYRVSSYGGGVIGKAGGLTVFELSKCGTRLIIDAMPAKLGISQGWFGNMIGFFNWIICTIFRFENMLPWEKINQDFAVSQGFATSVSTEKEFFTAFDKMLAESTPVKLKTSVMKFTERLPTILGNMKERAQRDSSLNAKRIYRMDPTKAASII